MRVLVVEDDREAARYICKGLTELGAVVDCVHDGEAALPIARQRCHDVMVVDRMMPRLDGLALIGILRAEGVTTPVLILSALGEVDERIRGLRAGGDDYLAKPYVLAELHARLEALVRRPAAAPLQTRLKVADLEMDVLARTVRRGRQQIHLHPREFKLLEYMMRYAGQVVTRTMLTEAVWNYHFDPQTNVVDVHVSRLRQKIDKGFTRPLIHTVRGAGYCLREPD
jgi:two-component system OmpR family response regulator